MTEIIQKTLRDSKSARWTALFLIAFTMLAAYFFVDMIAPLQTMLTRDYKWTPSNYGFFSGSEYMLNVVGFLIISGIILDKMGIRFTGLTAAGVMLLGGIIKLYGLSHYFNNGGFGYDFFNSFWTSMPASAKLAALGYAIFGIGVEMVGITVSKTIVKWFRGKELALAMGMEMAIARMGASVAFWLSPQFAKISATPQVVNSVYIGVALLAVGFLTFLTYTFLDKKIDKQLGVDERGNSSTDEFKVSDIGKILRNPGFITIAALCVLFYSGVFPFLKYATNLMESKLGVSAEVGGLISGLLPVGTIILTPLIGIYLDRKGKGATLMILGAALLTIAHFIYAVMPLNMFLAIMAIVILGVAFSLVPASMWPSVPKVVEDRYLGSAYALIFWIQNIGLMLIPMLIGVILDAVNPGVADRIEQGDPTAVYNYTVPMLVFTGLGLSAVVLAFVLKAINRKKGYGLEEPNIKS